MTPNLAEQERIRRYLLGQLADDARQAIERDLLTSGELFEELQIVEDELIDEYLAGKMSADENVQFRRHFMATVDRQDKVRFAGALHRYLKEKERASAPNLRAAMMKRAWAIPVASLALIVLIAAGLWLTRTREPRTFATVTLNLSYGERGPGDQPTRVKLDPDIDALKLLLKLPDSSPPETQYRAELLDNSGGSQSVEAVVQDSQMVSVLIRANKLKREAFAIRLFARGPDGVEHRINGNYLFVIE